MFSYKFTADELKERYKKLPSKLNSQFSLKDDLKLVKYSYNIGLKWDFIQEYFLDKDALMLKNRYYYLTRKEILEDLTEEFLALEKKTAVTIDEMEFTKMGRDVSIGYKSGGESVSIIRKSIKKKKGYGKKYDLFDGDECDSF